MGAFIIQTDQRDGLDGFWKRSFPVEGGGSTITFTHTARSPVSSGRSNVR